MLQDDTLAMQLKRPGTLKRDMSNCLVSSVVDTLNSYLTSSDFKLATPEKEAISFYSTNHVMSEVLKRNDKDSPLGTQLPLVETYQSELSKSAVRMFYYLLLICTRESRHVFSSYDWHTATVNYGAGSPDFTQSISGCGSDGAVSKFRQGEFDIKLGNYTKHLVDVFFNGEFSGGYGGEPWGQVAKVLANFVDGTYSAEMMMDTAFTLCHNNGPIFNKGMLYEHYDQGAIVKILDVQRSGQIPEMIKNKESSFVTPDNVELIKWCEIILEFKYSDFVNWYQVEALGSMHNYPNEKQTQLSNYGAPESEIELIKQAEILKDKQEAIKQQKILEDEQKYLEIMPGLKIKKVNLIRKPQ